ncbi:MAG TPA: acyl-CoA thioesterase domain-containing protein, partial [Nocardioides sp.]|nr:acyl-CoA thioesterase domain-containing protein [Nocardioides sp.]
MPASAQELLELLSLEEIDRNLFRGRQPDTHLQRVFGGQVAAQALIAACRTVDEKYHAHSLHSYFLLPGDTAVPIVYDVEQLRDGRSFATRRVVARQHGRAIFFLTASFQVDEDGFDHQDQMPETIPPEQGVPLTDLVRSQSPEEGERFAREWSALDVRYVGISGQGLPEDPVQPARSRLWIRVNGDLSDDPLEHLAAFTYASDLTLLGATLVP